MSLCRIAVAGMPVLKKRADDIAEITPAIRELAADMIETMKTAQGVGLAAPQVGRSVRLVIIDRGYLAWDALPEEERKKTRCTFDADTLVNPEIVSSEGSYEIEEGCLSVPGYRATVPRFRNICYRWKDLDGVEHRRCVEGLEAVALQHEIDHLDGVLFIDRISALKRKMANGKVRKFMENLDPEDDETAYRLYGQS